MRKKIFSLLIVFLLTTIVFSGCTEQETTTKTVNDSTTFIGTWKVTTIYSLLLAPGLEYYEFYENNSVSNYKYNHELDGYSKFNWYDFHTENDKLYLESQNENTEYKDTNNYDFSFEDNYQTLKITDESTAAVNEIILKKQKGKDLEKIKTYGVFINGTLTYNGQTPIDAYTISVMKNITLDYGFNYPVITDIYNIENGNNFHLLAGANSYLQISKNIGQTSILIKNITFNGGNNYASLSNEDAMRSSSNYERYLNINIIPSKVRGYIKDEATNEPLSNINIVVREIKKIENNMITEQGTSKSVKTNQVGYYNISDLKPGLYRFLAYNEEGYTIQINDLQIKEGCRNYNITKPKPGDIEGTVYYDINSNNKYDSGEEIEDATVTITFNGEEIRNTTTDNNGQYSFESLTSGWTFGSAKINEYNIEANKKPDFQYEEDIYVESETTKKHNISLSVSD